MPSTRKKLEGPVRSGQWGLIVDVLGAPRTVTILQFADKSRHTRSHIELGSFPFEDDADFLVTALTGANAVPESIARAMVRDLLAKVHSPRATADPLEQ